MKAMVLTQPADISTSPLQLRQRAVPAPGPGEVLVKVRVCGVCRTDLHVVEGELTDIALPIIPGHEAVGIVTEAGAGVSEWQPGDRVGIAWLQGTCG
jgi:alcohol dehydrogenase, propanol-preferring